MSSYQEPNTTPSLEELWVNRFLGLEIYHLESASWHLYRDEEDGRMNLWLHLRCDKAVKQFDDTAYTNTIPWWKLNVVEPQIQIAEGYEARVPSGYDEGRGGWLTNFYAGSHEASDNNMLRVLQVDGDRLLIRLTGEIIDPSFYDDSKPRAKLALETWFTKDAQGCRSMN